MARNAEKTKAAIMRAAIDEFAARGLAGARVDRIADSSGVSKPMIYNYFGNKSKLFDAAFEHEVLSVSSAVPFTVDDLTGYASRMHDYYKDHPRLWRFILWAGLERGTDAMALERGDDIREKKVRQLATAQAEGRISKRLSPDHLLRILVAITQMWCASEGPIPRPALKARRETIRRSVEKLIQPE